MPANDSTTIAPVLMKQHSADFNNLLPPDYRPSPNTVLVGRGREPKENLGNQRLRDLAMSFLPEYKEEGKRNKTRIVSTILSKIYDSCPEGEAFVKHNTRHGGQWFAVGTASAREKVGYVFRDLLADQYKSSSKSKVACRRDSNIKKEVDDITSQASTSSKACSIEEDDDLTTTTSLELLIAGTEERRDEDFHLTFEDDNADSNIQEDSPSSVYECTNSDNIRSQQKIRRSSLTLVFEDFSNIGILSSEFGQNSGSQLEKEGFQDTPRPSLLDERGNDFDYESLLKSSLVSE